MTCYRHMFFSDPDRPTSGLCDCGKKYSEHPVDHEYEDMLWAEQMMLDLEMEAEYNNITDGNA